jgi:hypothetical protein
MLTSVFHHFVMVWALFKEARDGNRSDESFEIRPSAKNEQILLRFGNWEGILQEKANFPQDLDQKNNIFLSASPQNQE